MLPCSQSTFLDGAVVDEHSSQQSLSLFRQRHHGRISLEGFLLGHSQWWIGCPQSSNIDVSLLSRTGQYELLSSPRHKQQESVEEARVQYVVRKTV